MVLQESATSPIACSPDAIPAAERPAHFQLMTRLFTTKARERRAAPNGCDYRFDADAFDDVALWLANERRCCPFLTFELELEAGEGPIWLRITGPKGTDAFLHTALPAVVQPSTY